jgi:integrase
MPAFHFVDDVLLPYMRSTSEDRRTSTQKTEASCFRRLEAFFDAHYLCDDEKVFRRTITGATVAQYREWRKLKGGVQAATIERELALASKAVNYAVREMNYDIANPFAGRLMSEKDRLAQRPAPWVELSRADEVRLLTACQPWLRDIVVFAIETGFRQSEVLGLTWDRVNGDEVTFTPETQKSRRYGTRLLSEEAQAIIARQPAMSEFVFQRGGRRIRRDAFYKEWRKARSKAGLEGFQFHWCRKTAGQRILDATGNVVLAQYQLGHSDLRTTQRIYTKEPKDQMREALRKVAGL